MSSIVHASARMALYGVILLSAVSLFAEGRGTAGAAATFDSRLVQLVARVQTADALFVPNPLPGCSDGDEIPPTPASPVFTGAVAAGCSAPVGTASGSAALSFSETHSGGQLQSVTGTGHMELSTSYAGSPGSASLASAEVAYYLNFRLTEETEYTISAFATAANGVLIHRLDQGGEPNGVEFSFVRGFSSPPATLQPQTGLLGPGFYRLHVALSGIAQSGGAGPPPNWSGDLTFSFSLGGAGTPSLSISDAVELEGAAGSNNMLSFPVSLSAPAPAGGVAVNYGTSDVTTQAGTDYAVTAGTLTFIQGQTAGTIIVPIVGDGEAEPNETLHVTLSNPVGATIQAGIGTGTILNDDATVDFDWTMPDRFGLDTNSNRLIDYFTTAAAVSPANWRVDFTYASGSACDPALRPAITIDGALIGLGDPALLLLDTSRCNAAYAFPREDVYQVEFELFEAGGVSVGQATHDVTVQDFLIVSLGDSVASGEGNPDIPGAPVWENRQCHRSASAGPAQAALALERGDPKTSVTFVHLACSGASVFEGVLTRYRGQEFGPWIPPQVDVMDSLVGAREIDAVTLSVGANDVRFAAVVTGCFIQTNCHLATTRNSMLQFFNGWLGLLPGNYDALGLTLRQSRYDVAPDRTYITDYFDAMRDQNANFCDQVILEESGQVPFFGISGAESQWASTDMMVRLNQQVAAAAGRNGWKFVAGAHAAFRTHGYCSNDRWIVQLTESLADQRNIDGTLHPNEVGHAFYGARLAASLTADLYTNGDLEQPRAPR